MLPKLDTILCATDLEPDCGGVLRHAISASRVTGAKLILLHVTEPMSPTSRAMARHVLSDAELDKIHAEGMAHLRQELLARLRAFCARELPEGVSEDEAISEIHLAEGPPAETIVKEGERLSADLLVMGLHSRSGLGSLLVGSVAQRVLHIAKKPVLLVPTAHAD